MRRAPSVLSFGTAVLWIAVGACGGDATPPVAPEEPDTVVKSIRVLPSERTLGVLGTQFAVGAAALTEDGELLYGSTLDPGRFSWSTSAPDVATVDDAPSHPDGRSCCVITGVGEGTAIITATSQGLSGSMTVTVRDRARLDWSVPLAPGTIGSGIAIGVDGTIYVGTDDSAANRSLWYAVSSQGGILWSLDLPLTWRSTPAIGGDGTLYVGSKSTDASVGSLIAVDPAGTVRWALEGIDEIRSAPALGSDGTIYVAGGRHLYAVDPEGEIRWVYETTEKAFTYSSPAVGRDGIVYVGGTDDLLYAINSDGSLRWTFKTGDLIQSSPSLGTDGTIYVGSMDGRLYAVNPDGTERWSVEVDSRGVVSSPSIGPDGTIYVGGGGVFAIDPGGSIRWSFPGSQVLTTPVLGADGTVYVAAAGGITALDAQGRLLWDYALGGHIFGSPAIGADGAIIAASFVDGHSDGAMKAIAETASTNGGYAGSPWPTARGDRANSGRAGG